MILDTADCKALASYFSESFATSTFTSLANGADRLG